MPHAVSAHSRGREPVCRTRILSVRSDDYSRFSHHKEFTNSTNKRQILSTCQQHDDHNAGAAARSGAESCEQGAGEGEGCVGAVKGSLTTGEHVKRTIRRSLTSRSCVRRLESSRISLRADVVKTINSGVKLDTGLTGEKLKKLRHTTPKVYKLANRENCANKNRGRNVNTACTHRYIHRYTHTHTFIGTPTYVYTYARI
jgi:hypothetical protein